MPTRKPQLKPPGYKKPPRPASKTAARQVAKRPPADEGGPSTDQEGGKELAKKVRVQAAADEAWLADELEAELAAEAPKNVRKSTRFRTEQTAKELLVAKKVRVGNERRRAAAAAAL